GKSGFRRWMSAAPLSSGRTWYSLRPAMQAVYQKPIPRLASRRARTTTAIGPVQRELVDVWTFDGKPLRAIGPISRNQAATGHRQKQPVCGGHSRRSQTLPDFWWCRPLHVLIVVARVLAVRLVTHGSRIKAHVVGLVDIDTPFLGALDPAQAVLVSNLDLVAFRLHQLAQGIARRLFSGELPGVDVVVNVLVRFECLAHRFLPPTCGPALPRVFSEPRAGWLEARPEGRTSPENPARPSSLLVFDQSLVPLLLLR